MPSCSDQALINYHFIKANKNQIGLLDKYGLIYCDSKFFIPPPPPSAPTDIILCHFVTPLGDTEGKKQRMISHVNHILDHYTNMHASTKTPDIELQTYTWGSGIIRFEKDKLVTTWGTGTYNWLDKNTVITSWLGFDHVLRMNDDYTEFYSIRKGDLMVLRSIVKEKAKKNLIYMCAFGTEDYYKMLELTLISMKLYAKSEGTDILIFTSKEFVQKITALSQSLDLPIITLVVEGIQSSHEAASYRLKIFEYEMIDLYYKILYIDIDLIIQGNIFEWFDLCSEDILYAVKDRPINFSDGLGSTLFDFSKIDQNTPGINTGTLLFRNSPRIRKLFQDVMNHIQEFKTSDKELPSCYEQPFVNFHAINSGFYNIDILSKHIFLTHNGWKGHEIPISPLANPSIYMNHFVGTPIQITKLRQQQYHMTHLLELYKSQNNSELPIVRNQYTWGDGRIVFEVKGVLITTWSRTGTYEVVNSRVVKASWSGFEHILIFNKTYTQFTSIRISDINVGVGHTVDTSLSDLIPIPSQPTHTVLTGSKNLLYFCIFHNRGYLELLEILLQSLIQLSNISEIDILVFTNVEFISFIKELSLKINKPISIHTCNFTTQHEAGCARLSIFDYYKINHYSKILYMDCDIVVQGDLSKLFTLELEDKVYAKQEYTVGGEGHGGWFFDFNTIDETTPAINSGILLFPNTGKIRAVFKDIKVHIQSARTSKALLPLCMDQSFIVYHLYKNDLYDNQLISTYIYLAEFTQPPSEVNTLLLCHFVWPIGNTEHKKNRMLDYVASVKRLNELRMLV